MAGVDGNERRAGQGEPEERRPPPPGSLAASRRRPRGRRPGTGRRAGRSGAATFPARPRSRKARHGIACPRGRGPGRSPPPHPIGDRARRSVGSGLGMGSWARVCRRQYRKSARAGRYDRDGGMTMANILKLPDVWRLIRELDLESIRARRGRTIPSRRPFGVDLRRGDGRRPPERRPRPPVDRGPHAVRARRPRATTR